MWREPPEISLRQTVVPLYMGQFAEDNGAKPIGRPITGVDRKEHHRACDAPGHRHAPRTLQEPDRAPQLQGVRETCSEASHARIGRRPSNCYQTAGVPGATGDHG